MSPAPPSLINQIYLTLKEIYKPERDQMNKQYKRDIEDYEFYSGYCIDASKRTLAMLHSAGYTQYKIGKTEIGYDDELKITHWFVYEGFDTINGHYIGVIDMTAVQFHNPDNSYIEDFIDDFKKYSWGSIPDSHSRKHYKK
ncbi:hypothetical protein [Priestia megaterium]|uniref:hypothetical protein n=1 Tax=Priestia megaterium TaxID=1404 RepID=UPI00366A9B0A